MKKISVEQRAQKAGSALEESAKVFGAVTMVIDVVYTEHTVRPCPEYVNVHLLCECMEKMFPGRLIAQHGYVYQLAAREKVNRFENPSMLMRRGMEVTVHFRKDDIEPKLGYLKALPHSWLLHKTSETLIDLIPLGAEPGVDYPVRHAASPFQPPFNADMTFGPLKAKLPSQAKIRFLTNKIEAWMKESSSVDLSSCVG